MATFIKNSAGSNPDASSGFTLVEMAVVVVIVGLLFTFILPTSTVVIDNNNREVTKKKLENIQAALTNFVMINRRLPCPADGTGVEGGLGAAVVRGVELRSGATTGFGVDCERAGSPATDQTTGVVPWVTLGLSESDTLDAWNNHITYRVAFGLTRDASLDMSSCDPIGTGNTTPAAVVFPGADTVVNTNLCDSALVAACTGVGTTCSNPQMYLVNKGFTIVDEANNVVMDPSNYTGAAFVLISHGANNVGAFSQGFNYIAVAARGVDGALEALNHNNGNAVSAASTTVAPSFRVTTLTEGGVAIYYDDLVLHPTVLNLVQTAQLGPRSH